MRQGWKFLSLCAALALVLAAAPVANAAGTSSDSDESTEVAKTTKKNRVRQFTGYVTLIDENVFTVEKRTKKKTRTKSFTMHEDIRVRGDLEEDAKVTVYYRTNGKRSIAHRVVVKLPPVDESEE